MLIGNFPCVGYQLIAKGSPGQQRLNGFFRVGHERKKRHRLLALPLCELVEERDFSFTRFAACMPEMENRDFAVQLGRVPCFLAERGEAIEGNRVVKPDMMILRQRRSGIQRPHGIGDFSVSFVFLRYNVPLPVFPENQRHQQGIRVEFL
jgi:hypothetical protein